MSLGCIEEAKWQLGTTRSAYIADVSSNIELDLPWLHLISIV